MSISTLTRRPKLRQRLGVVGIGAVAAIAIGAGPAQAATFTDSFCGKQYPPSGVTKVLTGHNGLLNILTSKTAGYRQIVTFTTDRNGNVTNITNPQPAKGTCPGQG